MNAREKTAALSTILNIVLTLLKFVMFGFTGSLAILAEAWHSFSDIATSFLVFIAVYDKDKEGEKGEKPKTSVLEQIVAFAIGLLLTGVSVLLVVKFFSGDNPPVRNSLISGIIFLAFALSSYLVYRFETAVGRQEDSVGLIADGMHARSDMVSSLVVGFSLIVYNLGIDVDRWAAGLIALFILSFAVETLFNSWLSATRKEEGILYRHRTRKIQTAIFDRDNWVSIAGLLKNRIFLKTLAGKIPRWAVRLAMSVGVALLLFFLVSSSFFAVDIGQNAVVERFGRPLDAAAPLGPGLHWKLPWPIDAANIVDTSSIRQMNIGNEVDANAFALLWTREHGTEIPFLSGDDNYFYPYVVVHYRVNNVYDYLYRHDEPDSLVKAIAYRLMTRLYSTKSFYEIVLEYRKEFGADMAGAMQDELDFLQAGIELVSVNVKDIHPPVSISRYFEGIIASLQDKEEMINIALGYATETRLESEGESYRLEEEAAGDSNDAIVHSEGDAARFLARIPADPQAMSITRTRLYLDALREALSGRDKVLFDPRAGTPEMWLNFGDALNSAAFDLENGQF